MYSTSSNISSGGRKYEKYFKNFLRPSRNIHFSLLPLQEGIYGQNSAAFPRMRHSVTRITLALRCSSFLQSH